jgi:hypothetical protein
MSDWQTLVRRIQEETHRYDSDSEDRIKRAICHAIKDEQYRDYYFNEATYDITLASGTFEYGEESSTGAADGYPAEFLKVRELTLEVSGYVQWPIRTVPLRRFRKDQITSSYRGYPDRWAWDREKILLDPTPNGAYTMITDYTANIGTPLAKYSGGSWAFTNSLTGAAIANADTLAWYDEAADLVCEMAKEYLYSNVWKDPQDAQIARGHVLELRKRFIREGRASQQTSYPKHYF